MFRSINPGFEFISGPIQTLFKDQPPSLTAILKVFTVLAVRFRRQYIHTTGMNWKLPFDTSIAFLEYCLTSTTPGDLAHTLKHTDEVDFAALSRTNLVAEDAEVKHLLANWRTLSTSVWECCSAMPDLIPHLQDCAQVSFFIFSFLRSSAPMFENGNCSNLACVRAFSDRISILCATITP